MDTAWFATLSAAIHFGWNACLGLPESIVIRRIAGRAYHAVDHDSCSTPGRVDFAPGFTQNGITLRSSGLITAEAGFALEEPE
jgi:hypothetical protein